jgi:hypothetical protein
MRPALVFDDVLDTLLKEPSSIGAEARQAAGAGTAEAYGFFFGMPMAANVAAGLQAQAGARVAHARFTGAVATPHVPLTPSSPAAPQADAMPRPRRPLAIPQQRALVELVTLGATLREDFTAGELRSAFRALARRYHPDRHATSDQTQREQLARQFARVHDAYRLLAES